MSVLFVRRCIRESMLVRRSSLSLSLMRPSASLGLECEEQAAYVFMLRLGSIWRRHLSDKHKIPLSAQPRRTRWDKGVFLLYS